MGARGTVTSIGGGVPADSGPAPRLLAAERMRGFLQAVDWSHLTFRRQQILEAFVALASTNGYESVTMRMLGAHVGVAAPSIYRHFVNGRDEIVVEAFRWHFYRFATAVLEGVDRSRDVEGYWNSLVRVHLQRQLESPENDMWDILMASDRIGGFLPAAARAEYAEWLGLYDDMYAAAARELGCAPGAVSELARIVVKVLDTVNEWYRWNGTQADLRRAVEQGTAISRALLGMRLLR